MTSDRPPCGREPACVPACVWCFFRTPCRVTWSIEGADESGCENVIATHFASAKRRPQANHSFQPTRGWRRHAPVACLRTMLHLGSLTVDKASSGKLVAAAAGQCGQCDPGEPGTVPGRVDGDRGGVDLQLVLAGGCEAEIRKAFIAGATAVCLSLWQWSCAFLTRRRQPALVF